MLAKVKYPQDHWFDR